MDIFGPKRNRHFFKINFLFGCRSLSGAALDFNITLLVLLLLMSFTSPVEELSFRIHSAVAQQLLSSSSAVAQEFLNSSSAVSHWLLTGYSPNAQWLLTGYSVVTQQRSLQLKLNILSLVPSLITTAKGYSLFGKDLDLIPEKLI